VTVETAPDGSIHFQDRFRFLRRGLVIASVLFVGLAATASASGADQQQPGHGKSA